MRFLLLLCLLFFLSCAQKETKISGKYIIEKSIQKHDPQNQWSTLSMYLQIQEPRVQNPSRYSIVVLDNATGAFSLQRNRETSISNHIIDSLGNAITYLDTKIVSDSALIKKYRLEPTRNFRYRRFYQLLMGLPMSLNTEKLDSISNATETIFNNIKSDMVSVELSKPMFSKHWNLYFSKEDDSMIGLEMVFPDDATKGERLFFEGSMKIQNVTIPRYKHWHELSGEYSGSDIIINEIK